MRRAAKGIRDTLGAVVHLRPRQLRLAIFALTPIVALTVACLSGDDGSSTIPAASAAAATATDEQTGERVATDGDQVTVHYRGTLDNGQEFDSSVGRDPLGFVVGSGQMIAGFDAADPYSRLNPLPTRNWPRPRFCSWLAPARRRAVCSNQPYVSSVKVSFRFGSTSVMGYMRPW